MILRWATPATVLAGVVGALTWRASIRPDPSERGADGSVVGLTDVLSSRSNSRPPSFTFRVVGSESGISFRHFPAPRASRISEDMGSGVAWGDYDLDGDSDLFLVNDGGEATGSSSLRLARRCRLYRNEGAFIFTDVSDAAGISLDVHGMGAAWGDFDADGDLDLSITCVGPNVLLENLGDGSFVDVSATAGVADPSFSAGCSWVDFDRDGRLDLSVCNYVNLDALQTVAGRTSMHGAERIPATLNPSSFPAASNRLYRNIDGRRFEDVAVRAGVADATGRSLEDAWFDFDRDGWLDLYVANDVSANGVFRNRGDGTFEDIGARSLAADYRGAMGLAVGDFDSDGDFDLLVTHWLAQENALFENMWSRRSHERDRGKEIVFIDSAEARGLGYVSLPTVGWA
ncbi:MAG: VCBS repeat-containing protein, partial [Myxococcales bacterium]|nr:VCBS repeat-containing protein [Myxococcales bacterium]